MARLHLKINGTPTSSPEEWADSYLEVANKLLHFLPKGWYQVGADPGIQFSNGKQSFTLPGEVALALYVNLPSLFP